MTINELKQSDKAFITPAVAASIIRCDPNYIRVAARQRPDLLGFPVCVMGHRTRIPRVPFIRFVDGGGRDE